MPLRLRCLAGWIFASWLLVRLTLLSTAAAAAADAASPPARQSLPIASLTTLLQQYCFDCHDSATRDGGLDLQSLRSDLATPERFDQWVRVYDKLQAGQMPPADVAQPDAGQLAILLDDLQAALQHHDAARQATQGRVVLRRLTRTQYEHTLRDLLSLPNLEIKAMLPEDGAAHGFDTVGAAQSVSYVQLARYLEAADLALELATVLDPRPLSVAETFQALEDGRLGKVARNEREAVQIDQAVGLLRQPNTAQAPWWWGKFKPRVSALYHLRLKIFGFQWDRGQVLPPQRMEVVRFYAKNGQSKRLLGTFDVPGTRQEPTVIEFTPWLDAGDQVEVNFPLLDDRTKPGDLPIDQYTAPGVAVQWLQTEGPLLDPWPPESYRRLFGDLPIQPWTADAGVARPRAPLIVDGNGKRAQWRRSDKAPRYIVAALSPEVDARRLLQRFMDRAFRGAYPAGEVDRYLRLVQTKLDQGVAFQEAMQVGYQAILCSPDFLFFQEDPGPLSDQALAARLSYFLWASPPDDRLRRLATEGKLRQPAQLRAEAERLLSDPRSQRFREDFLNQWLDLHRITVTEPDEQLYPEFDSLLLDSMVGETRAYFDLLVQEDLGIAHLVDADFAMLNQRLAEHYDVAVDEDGPPLGVQIRLVPLAADCPRGGLLTQASVLKVTANGTTTSPVTRGAWVLDRLLGQAVPPPPPGTPAIEPDLRGATTIRQQLTQHRDNTACAVCHRHIDPPGFALECFDVIGGYRQRYRSLEVGDTVDQTLRGNRPVAYRLGLPVDASGVAPSGEAFDGIEPFKQILLRDPQQLARNLAERLLVYATGAAVQFADRPVVQQIVDHSRDADYGVRTLIKEVVVSDAFRHK